MKFSLLPAIILVFVASGSIGAQTITEQRNAMSKGDQNVLSVALPDANANFADRAWKEYIRDYGRLRRVPRSKEMLLGDIQVLSIGGVNTVNIYSLTESEGDGSRHFIWVETGGAFINSSDHPDAYNGSVEFLQRFAQKVKVDLITQDIDTQQREVDRMERDLQRLRRDNDNLHKEIEQAKARIARAESDIAKNLQDQDLKLRELEAQREAIAETRRKLDAARTER